MNGKKAKQLRRECRGIAKMKQTATYPTYEMKQDEVTKKIRLKQSGHKFVKIAVNHYRNAKKACKGNVGEAVRAAIKKAQILEQRGVYSF